VTVTNVILENEYLRIEVAVQAAGRVMHVTYKQDGTELFNVLEKLAGGCVWDGGGWRSSFPFQEHGMHYTDQPCGWRVVEGEDGSVTLAMDMRFARFSAMAELGRYGRFTHLRLGRWITLRPGQAYFEVTSAVENPLPYRYGYRYWSLAQFPDEQDAEFLLPVSRVSGHGLRDLADWKWRQGLALHRNWDIWMSIFSVNVTYPFAGVYYPSEDLNRLRIADPASLPAGKLYAWPHPSAFYELWSGSEHLFEQEGRFADPFGRQTYVQRYYAARGIGCVDYANEHFAVSLQRSGGEGGRQATVRLLPAHDIGRAEWSLLGPDGNTLCRGSGKLTALVPQALACQADASTPVKVVVKAGGEVLLEVTLPLAMPEPDPQLERDLMATIRPDPADLPRRAESYEKRAWIGSRAPNLPSAALRAAMDWAEAQPASAPAQRQLGRVLYMVGRMDQAAVALRAALALDANDAQAHHLLGLVLLEQNNPQAAREQFLLACRDEQAAPEAHYLAAMGAISGGDRASAVEHLRKLVKVQPGAVRPRLVLAALLSGQGEAEEARAMAEQLEREDPSSPEVAYVLTLCEPREYGAGSALAKLLAGDPEAPEGVAQLRAEIERGSWAHPARPEVSSVPASMPPDRGWRRRGAPPRVLFLVGEGSEPDEFGMPYEALRALGYAVEIASPTREVQPLMSGRGRFQDPVPDLTLDQVEVGNYLGLILPGGNSPGNLEKFPKALEICRAFMAADKPVSGICHGPRLLLRAGLLKDRVFTCLFTVPDELADEWAAGEYGTYLDQPVVIDRNLTTSRYPYDITPFTRATADQLARAGGIPAVGGAHLVLITAPGAPKDELWVLQEVPAMCGLKVTALVAGEAGAAEVSHEGFDLLGLVNVSGESGEALAPYAKLAEAFTAAGKPVVLAGKTGLKGGDPSAGSGSPRVPVQDAEGQSRGEEAPYQRQAALAAIVAAARRTPKAEARPEVKQTVVPALAQFSPPARAESYQAVLALRQGFDDAVAAGALGWLQQRGKSVLVVGPTMDLVKGVNGLVLTPMATYAEAPKLAAGVIVVAPGSFWPEKREVRQATQPAWIERQEAQDGVRMEWLLAAREQGATLVVFGMDSMRLAAFPQFKGKRFAGPDQAFWAFSRMGARYTDAAALVSDSRIITARGAAAFDDAMELLGGV
jgi:protease I